MRTCTICGALSPRKQCSDLCRKERKRRYDAKLREIKVAITPPIRSRKRCPTCGHTKPASDFGVHKFRRDGLQSNCKGCRLNRSQTRDKARDRLRKAAWYVAHKSAARANNRRWLDEHPGYWRAAYYQNHEEILRKRREARRRKREEPFRYCSCGKPLSRERYYCSGTCRSQSIANIVEIIWESAKALI